ncbi:hypothetical protein EV421DRAFT_1915393 [Armillaria borealis]|uniref:Uncharacterized protein n=1 Tax=Armillaria borealis TaxID=47425 RepID=A0AA39IEI5_9AGAR|nr:hypothetical protein EV421DRAFT_1915393 [Armillaria borealis]
MVRKWIFTKGFPVGGAQIEKVLHPLSLMPHKNAFSEALLPHGFDFYQILGLATVQTLNHQFCSLPTFGWLAIHKFSNDVSGQKKTAARDYEDVLQCLLSCFEGLLPDTEDKTVLNVIFDFATWHALAKSWIHSDSSLSVLQAVMSSLGCQP